MKKILLTLVLPLALLFKVSADEGMWLPMLLGKQVYADMVKKGLKLTADQLYHINKASVKDAIVIFGRGCTGAIVSAEGLLFTNHHCGYDVIASASTVDHNYLRDGFYAKSKSEEIPAKNLSVQFLLRISDVTKEVMDSLKSLTGTERAQKQSSVLAAINKRLSDADNNIETRVSPIFKGNQFLAFVYQRYNDVRLVGTPSESIGKFGGDTDNWEWPRHTGDFSVFRVYMAKNGKPADHSNENIPLKPKWFLPVSLKGVKDGDYAMIYGYPGGTNRYETSYGIKQKVDTDNPTTVRLRDVRLKFMFAEMKKDAGVKLNLAPSYASIANYWKFFDGESKQLIKYNVEAQKAKEEEVFKAWAKGKPEYENILADYAKAYDAWRPYSKNRVFINEGIMGSPLVAFAGTLMQVENAMLKAGSSPADVKKAVDAATAARADFIAKENKVSDQNILGSITKMYYEEVNKDQQPIGFFTAIRNKYGDLAEEATFKKYAADIFNNTMIFDDAKWNDFVANPDALKLQDDPAFAHASAFIKNYNSKYGTFFSQFNTKNNELGRLYLKGIIEMNPTKIMYPDATFTMRVSYGNVKSYRPRDGVFYDNVTTSQGMLEKYVPDDYEFDLPDNVVSLLKKKDFGQYIDKQRKDLVVGFITTNDITGGNSGSPVINGNGELIGLAFDGNYEALSHKITFDKDLNRTINVDIRFVLWCIDKVGGAKNIIDELKLVR